VLLLLLLLLLLVTSRLLHAAADAPASIIYLRSASRVAVEGLLLYRSRGVPGSVVPFIPVSCLRITNDSQRSSSSMRPAPTVITEIKHAPQKRTPTNAIYAQNVAHAALPTRD